MDNDTKDLLMQYLSRVAEHYHIKDAGTVTFKKRSGVLDKLKLEDNNAWVVVDELFNTFIKEDRIKNDKEKFDKARVLWEAEHAAAEKEKVHAEMQLVKFCKEQDIPIGALSFNE